MRNLRKIEERKDNSPSLFEGTSGRVKIKKEVKRSSSKVYS
jgi:hypothetical protein